MMISSILFNHWKFLTWLLVLFLAGAINTLAYAPLSWLFLQYLAIGIFCYSSIKIVNNLSNTSHKVVFKGFLFGFAFGFGWFITGVSWVYITLLNFGGLPFYLAGLATLFFCIYLACFPAIACAGTIFLYKKLNFIQNKKFKAIFFAITFANTFTLLELLRAKLFTGFGWLSLGYAHSITSFLSFKNLAVFIGEPGIMWLVVLLISFTIYTIHEIINKNSSYSHLITISLVWFLVIFIANNQFIFTKKSNFDHKYLLVQGNLPIEMKWDEDKYEKNINLYKDLILQYKNNFPLTVILPETALVLFNHQYSQNFIEDIKILDLNLIAGGIEEDEGYYNSALIINSKNNHKKNQLYRKRHLVPFGEFPPPFFKWFAEKLKIPMANLQAGIEDNQNIIIDNIQAAITICYENLFPQEYLHRTNNANLLINISNTGWYGNSWATPQHLQISQMRAIEAQKPMIHVADTGISAYINRMGIIEKKIPEKTRGAILINIETFAGSTLYSRYGEKIIWLIIIISQLIVAILFFISSKMNISDNIKP